MRYEVSFASGGWNITEVFSTGPDAHAAARLLRLAGVSSDVSEYVPSLGTWVSDAADRAVLSSLMRPDQNGRARIITAIRFARAKSGVGLKEAKDWVEANFHGV